VDLLVPFHDDLVRIIHSELTLFFNALHALFLALAGLPPGSHLPGVQPVGTPAAPLLLLSRLAQLLSSSAIGKVSAVGACSCDWDRICSLPALWDWHETSLGAT